MENKARETKINEDKASGLNKDSNPRKNLY